MRIVVSLGQNSADSMLDAARRTDADLFEIRADLLKAATREDLARLVRDLPRPAIVTVRMRDEGGAFAGSEDERESLLLAAIDAGAHAVDVEAASSFRERVVAVARGRGVRVVLSAHDLAGTPPAADILQYLRDAASEGAWVGKVAATIRGPEDAVALIEAAEAARREGLSFALMAVNDAILRLVAPLLGQALAYARPDDAPPALRQQRWGEDVAEGHVAAAVVAGQVAARDLRRAAARLPAPGPGTRVAFLLGHPVAHSASPLMQNAAFRATGIDAVYLPVDVGIDGLAAAVRGLPALGALGANVTIPHKEAVLRHVDALDETARAAGAANVLAVRDGAVVAHNTDGAGALAALHEGGLAAAGSKLLLLGAGGAARAVALALTRTDARVVVTNRTEARAMELSRTFGTDVLQWDPDAIAAAAAKADLLVNPTSIGLHEDVLPVPPQVVRPGLAVLDCVYRPGGTALARAARAAGATVVPGEIMLLHQGAAAFELWTGEPAPVAAMRAALAAFLEGTR